MASTGYMSGRKKWARPQGMLWSDTPPILVDGKFIPSGYEVYSDQSELTQEEIDDSFIVVTDHNRTEINVSTQRIEKRQRMVNGTMRSYHIADKISLTTSWSMLPSRSFNVRSDFNQDTGLSVATNTSGQYTVDGGAGGSEMLKWYEDHKGPFWVFLSYDKYTNFGVDNAAHNRLSEYSQAIKMYISNFEYSIVKRGSTNHDLWNISVTLEEV